MGAEIPDALRPRLGQLVKVLASSHPGEVVAAAAALKRALAGCGADLNDLGETIGRTAEQSILLPQEPVQSNCVRLDPTQRTAVLGALRHGLNSPHLSKWEASFARSMLERLVDSRAQLTQRQARATDRVLQKLAGAHR